MPDALTTVPGNSGDRVWEVENANGTVQAEFVKQDGSARELLVEIYKDGKSLTSGTTTIGHGSVALSVNLTTGIAAAPVTSGGGTAKTACGDNPESRCRHDNSNHTVITTIPTTAVASTHHGSVLTVFYSFLWRVFPSFIICRCLHCSGVLWSPVTISP